MTVWTLVDSPVEPLLVTASAGAVTGVYFSPHKGIEPSRRVASPTAGGWRRDDDEQTLVSARVQLGEYFARRRRTFVLPLAPVGTPFQLRVWMALAEIGYGATRSYGELASGSACP